MKIVIPTTPGRLLLIAATSFLLSACGQQWSSSIIDDQAGPKPLPSGGSFPIVEEYLKREMPGVQVVGIRAWYEPQLAEKNGQRYWRISFEVNQYGQASAYIQNQAVKMVE